MDLDQLIAAAIEEDLPKGDLTCQSLDIGYVEGEAHVIAKEDLVLSGITPFDKTIKKISPDCEVRWNFKEGDLVLDRQVIAVLEGNLMEVLQAERTALNFLGALSGIASYTACFAKKVAHTKTKILDTRKTRPGYRTLEKLAVVHGGGCNHRMDLSDAVMIKENHVQVSGSITNAVERIRRKFDGPIEVEVQNLEDVREAIELGTKSKVTRLMLDNMSNEMTAEALDIIPKSIETEASGNMTLDRVAAVAELGVDFISIGALTHSAPCADISMLFLWQESRG